MFSAFDKVIAACLLVAVDLLMYWLLGLVLYFALNQIFELSVDYVKIQFISIVAHSTIRQLYKVFND